MWGVSNRGWLSGRGGGGVGSWTASRFRCACSKYPSSTPPTRGKTMKRSLSEFTVEAGRRYKGGINPYAVYFITTD